MLIKHISVAALLTVLHSAPLLANTRCEDFSRQFIGAELGGPRSYANGLIVNTVPFGPASNRAGIDMVSSPQSAPPANANVHWYKDEIIAVHITWRPRTEAELSAVLERLLRLPGVPPSTKLRPGDRLTLPCARGVDATALFNQVDPGGGDPKQALLGLSITNSAKQISMQNELRGKDTRMPGPP